MGLKTDAELSPITCDVNSEAMLSAKKKNRVNMPSTTPKKASLSASRIIWLSILICTFLFDSNATSDRTNDINIFKIGLICEELNKLEDNKNELTLIRIRTKIITNDSFINKF